MTRSAFPRLRVADEALVRAGELLIWIGLVIMELMRLPTLVVGGRLGGLLMLGARWCPVVLGLHRFFIAIARAVVNHDGVAGTSLDPMVWSVGGAPERRRVVHAVRDKAVLPGPAGVWDEEWRVVAAAHITCHDIELWQYSASMLVKCVSFFVPSIELRMERILEWVVSLMVSCSSFMSYGLVKRLVSEMAVPQYRGARRSIPVSAVPFGPGTDIWRSCSFIGALFRALVGLPGGIRRFVSCDIGTN